MIRNGAGNKFSLVFILIAKKITLWPFGIKMNHCGEPTKLERV